MVAADQPGMHWREFEPLLIVSTPLLISSQTALRSLGARRGRLLPYTATKAQVAIGLSFGLAQIWAHVIGFWRGTT